MGVGGGMAAVILFSFYYQQPLGLAITIATLLAGLVCTCRLLLGDHSGKEIYTGLFTGIGCQLAAYFFVM